MKSKTKTSLDNLKLQDVYSLLLFALYRIKDVPDFAVLSELCYLLDGNNITRLLTYFAGKTITFPDQRDLVTLVNALLLYQYINLQGKTFIEAQNSLKVSAKQKEEITELYTKLLPIMNEYNVDRRGAR